MSKGLIDLTIIVNGEPVALKIGVDKLVLEAVERALKESGNSGQALDKWELRNNDGQVIDTEKTIGALDIKDGATLFLNLKAGVGGNDA